MTILEKELIQDIFQTGYRQKKVGVTLAIYLSIHQSDGNSCFAKEMFRFLFIWKVYQTIAGEREREREREKCKWRPLKNFITNMQHVSVILWVSFSFSPSLSRLRAGYTNTCILLLYLNTFVFPLSLSLVPSLEHNYEYARISKSNAPTRILKC